MSLSLDLKSGGAGGTFWQWGIAMRDRMASISKNAAAIVVVVSLISGGIYLADSMSWVREDLGHVVQVRKMSGSTWTQLYEYDKYGRLLVYKYSDSNARNHTISYDSETGEETDHRID